MNHNVFVLVIIFLISVSFLAIIYVVTSSFNKKKKTRRRWARIKIPSQKAITCKIVEPEDIASDTEFLVNDINVGGISFYSPKQIKKTTIKLLVRFPFTSFQEASSVWGKVVYCNQLPNSENYRVGISYIRHRKGGK
ncbi:MAG: hypothetical protein N2606_07265 [Candidatus Omnitrophica bacterium]|nr:hypothetical protein [Candidatus Omnitrophota bacterium]